LVTHQTGPEGRVVKRLYVESRSNIKKEYYLSLVMDRVTKTIVIMASTEGGMDIEEVAEHQPDKIISVKVDQATGIQGFHARKIGFALGFKDDLLKKFTKLLFSLYKAFNETDASQLEINPLVETVEGDIVALDAKYNFDDNALYRHLEIRELRDLDEEEPLEIEASKYDLNYVKMDGKIGCMVNGAGLAMATMDMIKLAGGEPANFLDVGGSANATTVEAGFRIIMKDPNVKAILINIFGGIVRCDRVAAGVIEAFNKLGNINIPIIVRLQGTNAVEAKKLIDESGLKVQSAILLSEAADLVKQAVA
jgi:succinyl-CoA synthetase beta subunit